MIYRHPVHLQFKTALENKGIHTSDYHTVPDLNYNGPVAVVDRRLVEHVSGVLNTAAVPYHVDYISAAPSVAHVICKDPDVLETLRNRHKRETATREREERRTEDLKQSAAVAAAAEVRLREADLEEAVYVPTKRRGN